MECPTLLSRPRKPSSVGKKQILDQCFRIERQLRLIERHERDGYPDLASDAVRMLAEMERALARMQAHHAKAQAHLPEVTVDEPSLAEVERDTPM
jgi:hypothetical protein